jgi:hypothetical protein
MCIENFHTEFNMKMHAPLQLLDTNINLKNRHT